MAVAHPAPPLTADEQRSWAASLEGSPSSPIVFSLLALAMAIALFLLYTLWEFWPTAVVLKAQSATNVHILGMQRSVSAEIRLFVVVALSGALGGLLHATRSFAWYVGHSSLKWRWMPYYIVTLVIGAGLATIVYVVIRGGIVSGKASTTDVNPYGFAAIAAIVGLFSEQALEMLRRVATDFFAEAPTGTDTATPANAPPETAATDVTDVVSTTPAVSTGAVLAVGATTASLSGRVSPNGAVTTYHFDYGKTADYGLSTSDGELSGVDPVDVSVDLTDLTPATEYHFRLVAANGADVVDGTDVTFTTAAA